MIIRLVKLKFQVDQKVTFLAILEKHRKTMKEVVGCRHLALWEDTSEVNTLVTHSIWDSEIHLNNYRQSEVFHQVWSKVKPLFAAPAQVSSLNKLM